MSSEHATETDSDPLNTMSHISGRNTQEDFSELCQSFGPLQINSENPYTNIDPVVNNPVKRRSFLELPGEIRNIIYTFLVLPYFAHILTSGRLRQFFKEHAPLMQVCRQSRLEFTPIFFSETPIYVRVSKFGEFLTTFKDIEVDATDGANMWVGENFYRVLPLVPGVKYPKHECWLWPKYSLCRSAGQPCGKKHEFRNESSVWRCNWL